MLSVRGAVFYYWKIKSECKLRIFLMVFFDLINKINAHFKVLAR